MFYEIIYIYRFIMPNGAAMFWPVMARSCRQRFTRYAFVHPTEAVMYGIKVELRFRKIYGECEHG